MRGLQRLTPAIADNELMEASFSVRAQFLLPDEKLVDDFLIARGPNLSPICDASSSAATASFEIRKAVASEMLERQSSLMLNVAGLGVLSGGGQERP